MFDVINNLDKYYAVSERNKQSGRTYNEHALPLQLEFLGYRAQNELEANAVSDGLLIMDRCLYEDYYIFASSVRHLGQFTRLHN